MTWETAACHLTVVPEATFEDTDAGLVSKSAGWFVLNARDARWFDKPGQGHSLPLTGDDEYEAETVFGGYRVELSEQRGACVINVQTYAFLDGYRVELIQRRGRWLGSRPPR